MAARPGAAPPAEGGGAARADAGARPGAGGRQEVGATPRGERRGPPHPLDPRRQGRLSLNRPRPALTLPDINPPGLSGLDLMRHAKSEDAELVVIVVTGHASASSAIDALRQGAYDYITKPFDLDEVHQIVERGIANRRLTTGHRRLRGELRQKNEILKPHENLLRAR